MLWERAAAVGTEHSCRHLEWSMANDGLNYFIVTTQLGPSLPFDPALLMKMEAQGLAGSTRAFGVPDVDGLGRAS